MIKTTDRQVIHLLFEMKLRSIGVVSVAFAAKGLKRYYTIVFMVICSILIIKQSFPIWILAIPIIPLIIFWLLYIIDLNIMIQSLVDIQKTLIEEYNLAYDLNQLLDELQDYAKEKNLFKIGSR
jgi:hypothetical protein